MLKKRHFGKDPQTDLLLSPRPVFPPFLVQFSLNPIHPFLTFLPPFLPPALSQCQIEKTLSGQEKIRGEGQQYCFKSEFGKKTALFLYYFLVIFGIQQFQEATAMFSSALESCVCYQSTPKEPPWPPWVFTSEVPLPSFANNPPFHNLDLHCNDKYKHRGQEIHVKITWKYVWLKVWPPAAALSAVARQAGQAGCSGTNWGTPL